MDLVEALASHQKVYALCKASIAVETRRDPPQARRVLLRVTRQYSCMLVEA
jgi:hypothetical protein